MDRRYEDRRHDRSRSRDRSRGDFASRDDEDYSRRKRDDDYSRRKRDDDDRDYPSRRRDKDDEDYSRRKDDSTRRDNRQDSSRENNYSRRKEEAQVTPDLYSVCKARVHSIKPFGIFVRFEAFRCQGLVHLSQVSNHEVTQRDDPDEVKIQALSAIYDHGENVWVKIISVKQDEDGGGGIKIGCSIKYVSQKDGTDLDPNNLQLETQESRPPRSRDLKTSKDAIYDVVCPRCGGRGHLKNECYATGSKVYELLPEEEDEPEVLVAAKDKETSPARSPRVGKKRDRLPDSVSTVEEAKALIALLKAEKKDKRKGRKHSKRRKRRKSSSSSPSSTGA